MIFGVLSNDTICLIIGLVNWIAFFGIFILAYLEKLVKKQGAKL
jgi:hypothetical protein